MTTSAASNEEIAQMVGSLRARGVQLWSDNGNLRYRAGRGVLSAIDLEHLRASRERLVALLEVRSPQHAPVTFSQLQHWHLYHLEARPAIRQIASATRLQGRLDVEALRRSISEIVRRQEALRTRIVIRDGVPQQEISDSTEWSLHVADLTSTPQSEQDAAIRLQIDEHILQPIDIAQGPLFGVRLLQLSAEDHVMIVAMEHSVSDGFSMNLLLREFFTGYAQACQNRPFMLPPVQVSFTQYARRQQAGHQRWVQEHGSYWSRHLEGSGRLRFPHRSDGPLVKGWGTVPVHIDTQQKNRFSEWCRTARTTLPLAMFTAYVALVLRWCNAREMTVRYVIDGRERGTENTIGFFASMLYLRVSLGAADTFFDLLKKITQEYCNAYRHADHCYLESSDPRPEFARGTAFNWLPGGTGLLLPELNSSSGELVCRPIAFEHPLRRVHTLDNEPVILLNELRDEIVGGVSYPLAQFSAAAMDRFVRNFLYVVDIMHTAPSRCVEEIEMLA